MLIRRESINHYLPWLAERKPFSFVGFSDAEWRCIFGGEWEGSKTGLGQIIDSKHGERLADIIVRREKDPRWLFAIPECLWPHRGPKGEFKDGFPGFSEGQIDWWLGRHGLNIVGWERDRVLDDLAREAKLYPLINELRCLSTGFIGPEPLRPFFKYLGAKWHINIPTPNFHLRGAYIDSTLALVKSQPQVQLVGVSAGVSAAVIIDRLHDYWPETIFFDFGSIWDVFGGIGGQREWRAKLYANPRLKAQWIEDCLQGKGWRARSGQPLELFR